MGPRWGPISWLIQLMHYWLAVEATFKQLVSSSAPTQNVAE